MTPEEIATKIIDMQEGQPWVDDPKWYFNTVMDYIKLAIHLEREACAKIADDHDCGDPYVCGCQEIAHAIRARSESK